MDDVLQRNQTLNRSLHILAVIKCFPFNRMCTTIEYIIPQVVTDPPAFLLVLDIALIEEELEQAKDSDRHHYLVDLYCTHSSPHITKEMFMTCRL